MIQRRWLRIIPVALIMYTISYADRTNISLALDREISSMMKDCSWTTGWREIWPGYSFWVISCYKFREAIWRPVGAPGKPSACCWFSGGVRGGLRAFADFPGI